MRLFGDRRSDDIERYVTAPTDSVSGAQLGAWIKQGVFLTLGVLAIYLFSPQILDVVSSAPRLLDIRPRWFVAMFLLETASFACMWWLTRIVLPGVSWFVAATSQLVSNAVSRVVPAGAAVGGATLYRMLSVSGVSQAKAGGALAATSIISTGALFAIPTTSLVLALLGAPIPEDLWPAAVAGGVMFVALVGIGAIAVLFDRPLWIVSGLVDRVVQFMAQRWGRQTGFRREEMLEQRDALVEVVGPKWPQAITAAAGNWAFDYLTLVAALYAVGADPRLSLVLLAYAGAAVLAMIPITPGGLGFVEAGLIPMLVLSGTSAQNALLAAFAYRVFSLWLPILLGPGALLAYRRRFRAGRPRVASMR